MRWPRTPSAKIVTLAWMSAPGSNAPFGLPSLPMPRSPVRTPIDARSAVVQHVLPRKPPEQVDALGFDLLGQPLRERAERDDVVAVILKRRRRDRQPDLAAPASGSRCCRCRPACRAARPWTRSPESDPSASTDRAARPTVDARRLAAPFRSPRSTAARRPLPSAAAPAAAPPTARRARRRRSGHQLRAFVVAQPDLKPTSAVQQSAPARARTDRPGCRSRRPRRSAPRRPC